MSKTLFCIQTSRTLIVLLTLSFILLSQMQIFHLAIIPWPTYHSTVAIILDLVLVIGLIASLTQHLKTLIFFAWLSALTFLLIFFGNTVSSQYQSDLIGMFYLLLICILAFTDAVCIIKYRMPSEQEAHHPLFMKCSQSQPHLFEQMIAAGGAAGTGDGGSLILPPLPVSSSHHSGLVHAGQQPPLPPPPPPAAAPSSQSLQAAAAAAHHGILHHHSPSSPISPVLNTSASASQHCGQYVAKNDPQFHAV